MLVEGDKAPEGDKVPEGDKAPEVAAVTWDQVRASIPEELRADKSMETITSLEGLTKSFIHAQKAMGHDKFVVPDKHASPEDWAQVFQKLGNPEKVEDYKVNIEGESVFNQEIMDNLRGVAHKAGVLPHQYEQIVKSMNEQSVAASDQIKVSQDADYTKQMDSLKSEWGEQFDNQVKKANAAFKHLVPEKADRDAFLATGMGDHPMVAKLLASASKMMSEDAFVGAGDGSLGGLTPADALKKAQDIQGNMDHPYRNKSHPGHMAAKKEVTDLYATAFPEEK